MYKLRRHIKHANELVLHQTETSTNPSMTRNSRSKGGAASATLMRISKCSFFRHGRRRVLPARLLLTLWPEGRFRDSALCARATHPLSASQTLGTLPARLQGKPQRVDVAPAAISRSSGGRSVGRSQQAAGNQPIMGNGRTAAGGTPWPSLFISSVGLGGTRERRECDLARDISARL